MSGLAKDADLILYRDPRHYAAFPSIARLADGHMAVAFRRARDPRWMFGEHMQPDNPDFDRVDHLDGKRSFRPWNGSRQAHLPR